jgi:WD40 repeat protein
MTVLRKVRTTGGAGDHTSKYKYDAFVSYSHAADAVPAKKFRRELHAFNRPWYRLRALRVFIDNDSLSASPGLWSSIEKALASSKYFVLLASRPAAGSSWVEKEVRYWLDHRDPERILIVVTEPDGEVVWDDQAVDFDWARTQVLPRCLSCAFRAEPRWPVLPRDPDANKPQFRDAVVDVAATIHGRDRDEIFGEDVRRQKTAKRLSAVAIVTLLIFLGVAVGAAAIAVDQRDSARAAQRTSAARGMVSQADAARTRDPRLALQLGTAAYSLDPSAQTLPSLLETLSSTRHVSTLAAHEGRAGGIAVSPDGRTLASVGSDRLVVLWDISGGGEPVRIGEPLTGHTGSVDAVTFSPDGETLVTSGDDPAVMVWDVSDRQRPRHVARLEGHTTGWVRSLVFTRDGRTLASFGFDHKIILWDFTDPGAPHRIGQPLIGHTDIVWGAAFSRDGRALFSEGIDDKGLIWDLSDRDRPRLAVEFSSADRFVLSPDGRILAVASPSGVISLWDVTDPVHPRRLKDALTDILAGRDSYGTVEVLAFSPDGTLLAGATREGTEVWDVRDPGSPSHLSARSNTVVPRGALVEFSPDGRQLTIGSTGTDGVITIWDVSDRRQRRASQHTDPPGDRQ